MGPQWIASIFERAQECHGVAKAVEAAHSKPSVRFPTFGMDERESDIERPQQVQRAFIGEIPELPLQ